MGDAMQTTIALHRAIAATAIALVTLVSGCGRGERGPDENTTAEPRASSPGCPAALTVGSGLGNNQVPVLFLAPEGAGFGSQVSALVRKFNNRASEVGFRHCLAGGCLCEYIPADDTHVVYKTGDIGGWTEVTILPTGGQPQVLPAGTVKRHGKIVPPSPNVVCVTPPPLPPRPATSTGTTTPTTPPPDNLPPAPPPAEVECRQPTWLKPAGTVLIEKQFPFTPANPQAANDALVAYINTVMQSDIDAVLNTWRIEIGLECQDLNPGGTCTADFDAEPTFSTEAGDAGLGAQLFMFYRVRLGEDLKGQCKPQ